MTLLLELCDYFLQLSHYFGTGFGLWNYGFTETCLVNRGLQVFSLH